MNDNTLRVVEVDINDVLPNRFQPRLQFEEDEILELSDSNLGTMGEDFEGYTSKEDCIMIGDSIKSDKVGAENAGIDCYIVNIENSLRDLLQMIIGVYRKSN